MAELRCASCATLHPLTEADREAERRRGGPFRACACGSQHFIYRGAASPSTRAASRTAAAQDDVVIPPTPDLHQRIRAMRGAALSDADLRRALDTALRSTVPGYVAIESVFPDEQRVVYTIAPDATSLNLEQRTYAITADGAVTVHDDATAVKPVTVFEPVQRSASEAHIPPAPDLLSRVRAAHGVPPKLSIVRRASDLPIPPAPRVDDLLRAAGGAR